MKLRVATLNVWALPAPFSRDLAARMGAIAESLPAYDLDVVGFQEVWLGSARDSLVEAGRRSGLVHAWSRSGVLDGGGLLLLSRFPIRAERFESFRVRGRAEEISQGEFFAGKGYLNVVLDTPAGRVRVLNTHLHARYSAPPPDDYRTHRTAQIVQLAEGGLDTGPPLIVLGDFNFSEQDPEYRVLRGLMRLRDAAADLDRRDSTVLGTNPYRAGAGGQRKDYVFGRDGAEHSVRPVRVERVFDEELSFGGRPGAFSDHAGVRVEFEVAAASGSASPPPDRSVVRLAADLLAQGKAAAQQRRGSQQASAWQSACIGAAAVGIARYAPVSRRSILRHGVQALGLAVVVPRMGLSMLSSWSQPDEARAFGDALQALRRLVDRSQA